MVAIILLVVLFSGMRNTPTPRQPNVQATDVNIIQNIERSPQETVYDDPRVSSLTFQFVATQSGTYFFNFDNSFSVGPSPTKVSLLLSLGDKVVNETIYMCPGCMNGIGDDVSADQVIVTRFNVTGGSPNALHFSITVQSCSHTIGFNFTLVNTGTANGNATVNIQSGATSYWQHSYLVAQGQHLAESGSSNIPDCAAHNYNLTVTSLAKT